MLRKSAVRWAAWAVTAFTVTCFLATVAGFVCSIAYPVPDSAYVIGEDKMWSGIGTAFSILAMSILFGLVIALVPSWKIGSGICAGLGVAFGVLTLVQSDLKGIPSGLGTAGAGIAAALVGLMINRTKKRDLHPIGPSLAMWFLSYCLFKMLQVMRGPHENLVGLVVAGMVGGLTWSVVQWAREKPGSPDAGA